MSSSRFKQIMLLVVMTRLMAFLMPIASGVSILVYGLTNWL